MSHHNSQPPHHHASHSSHRHEEHHSERQASHPAATPVAVKRPSHDEIAKRAYDKFLGRNRQSGADQDDWFKAEQELVAELNRK